MPRDEDRSGTAPRGTVGGRDADLPVTAQRVLEAAKRIIAERGLPALTLDAVAEESGEYRSAIRYHFGDKAGLLSAVMDSTALSPTTVPLFAAVSAAGQGRSRAVAHAKALQTVSADTGQFRLFWALLPHVLNDPVLRARLSGLYERYARINREAFGGEAAGPDEERRLRGLARLLTAACDGLGLMTCLEGDGRDGETGGGVTAETDIGAAWEVLGDVLEEYVRRCAAPVSGTEPLDERGDA
jgi:AcrR family transcriptional regulator